MRRRRVVLWTGAVLATVVAGAVVLTRLGGAAPVALPDPAQQATPPGSAVGATIVTAGGTGSATRPVASHAGQVLVRYACSGTGTVTIGVLGASTSGQCFAGQPVEYAAALDSRTAGSLQVGAPRGVHWRVVVSALS